MELGLRIAATLWLFWDVRGHVQEGRQPLRELLQVPEAQTPKHARGRALLSEAWLGYVRGDVNEVDSVVADAIAIARGLGDRQIEGRALSILGAVLQGLAEQALEEATRADGQSRHSARAMIGAALSAAPQDAAPA